MIRQIVRITNVAQQAAGPEPGLVIVCIVAILFFLMFPQILFSIIGVIFVIVFHIGLVALIFGLPVFLLYQLLKK